MAHKPSRREASEAAWRLLPQWEGSHWSIRSVNGLWVIVARDGGPPIATMDEGRAKPRRGPYHWPDEVRVVGGPAYRQAGRHRGLHLARSRRPSYYLDAASGAPVIELAGEHGDWRPRGTVEVLGVPSPTGVGQLAYRFPVSGTSAANAVMTALDNAATPVFFVRHVPPAGGGARRRANDADAYDIVVNPRLQPSPTLFLIAAVVAPWLVDFFVSSGY